MLLLLVIILLVLAVGGLPAAPWGTWHGLGYYPSSLVTIILIVLVILLLMGRV